MESESDMTKNEKLKTYGFLYGLIAIGLSLLVWLVFYFPPTAAFFERNDIAPRTAAFLILASVFLPLFVAIRMQARRAHRQISGSTRPTDWLPKMISDYDELTFPGDLFSKDSIDDDVSIFWEDFIFAAEAIATSENNAAGPLPETCRARLAEIAGRIKHQDRVYVLTVIKQIAQKSEITDYWKKRKDSLIWSQYLGKLSLRLSRSVQSSNSVSTSAGSIRADTDEL